jgi:hypothetical protein
MRVRHPMTRRDRPLRRTSEAARMPIIFLRPTGRSTAKGSCDRTTGAVFRGTESLLTLRWSGVDSNVQFRLDRQRFHGFVRVGSISRRPGHPSTCRPRHPIELSRGGQRSRHSPRGSGSVGRASASRNRRFESAPLRRRVRELSVPLGDDAVVELFGREALLALTR